MVHIKLFIKNTLTNLFPTFYRGSHPINDRFCMQKNGNTRNSPAPVNTYPKSPVQNESEGKGGGVETVPIWVFIGFVCFKAFRDIPPKQGLPL